MLRFMFYIEVDFKINANLAQFNVMLYLKSQNFISANLKIFKNSVVLH